MRGEDRASYSLLATLLPLKNGIENSKVRSWIRLVNFALPRSMSLCLRGLRQNLVNEKLDIELERTNIKNNGSKLLYKQYFCFLVRGTLSR